jgi:general secretion pathway protein K
LAEARLSTFLAAADQNASTDTDDPASETFLSGSIIDLQSRLNITNLVDGGKINEAGFRSLNRLFAVLGIAPAELLTLSENLRLALDTTGEASKVAQAPLLPQRLPELVWLGLSPLSIARLKPYITLLPTRTTVNLNTASAEVIYAAVPGLDMARAKRLVNERERTPFRTLAEAQRLITEIELNAAEHGVGTRFFEVRGKLRTPRGTVEEQSLVQRDGFDVRILRRERMVPQAGS